MELFEVHPIRDDVPGSMEVAGHRCDDGRADRNRSGEPVEQALQWATKQAIAERTRKPRMEGGDDRNAQGERHSRRENAERRHQSTVHVDDIEATPTEHGFETARETPA